MDYTPNSLDSIPAASRLSVMPIGDSRTAGNGSTVRGGYKLGLFQKLQSRLGYAPRFTGSNAVATCFLPNCATSGYTAAQILSAVQTQSPLFPTTNVYLLDAGTNDVIAGTAASTIVTTVLAIEAQIRTDNPSATVFIANLYDRSGSSAGITAFNSALATGVAGLSNYSSTPTAGKTMFYNQYSVLGPYSVTYWGDVTHLNAAGYNLAADGWFNQIAAVY